MDSINTRKELLAALVKANVAFVEVDVEGCGDSGEVANVTFFDDKKNSIDIDTLPDDFETYVGDIIFDVLTSFDADFWNNEGGEGSLTLNVQTGTFDAHIDVNVITSERMYTAKNEDFIDED